MRTWKKWILQDEKGRVNEGSKVVIKRISDVQVLIDIGGSFFLDYLSRGLFLPRVKSILTLLTATSSSRNVTPPFFCCTKNMRSILVIEFINWRESLNVSYRCKVWASTWEQTISWAVTFLKFSSSSLGTAYSLQNCRRYKRIQT